MLSHWSQPLGIAGVCLTLLLSGCSSDRQTANSVPELTKLTVGDERPLTLDEAMLQCGELETFLVSVMVGAGKGDTFDAKSAEFLVSAIPEGEEASDPGHDPSTCPFCRKRAESAPTVVVRMLDGNGKPFPGSAEQLFQLKRGMHIVVRGSGIFDSELNTLTINATGLAKL
ncbi:hypothetical protein SH449x_003695 [Pirellulaceae bacterium SH449]